MPSACLTSHKQEGQRGWLSQEANANRPLRLALAKGACSLATGSSCGELRLVPSPSLACFPETRYAFAKPNRLWQRQLKISSAFVSLELGPAEGTGNQPNPGLFFFFFFFPAAAEAPLQCLPRLRRAAPVTREPRPWSTRKEGCMPYQIRVAAHAAASGCLSPARALRAQPRLPAGDLGAEPGIVAPDCACLCWAVCFWDFSKADGVRGPLSRGTVIPLEAGL